MEKKGKTFIISGPSGVGKSTVLGALFEGRDDLYFSVSATTRAPRPTETLDLDVQDHVLALVHGATQVHELRPDVVRIFIAPPSWEELERRLTARGTDSPEKVQKRLLRAKVELENAGHYDYFVINDTVDNAVAELRAIMLAEHCRPAERIAELNQ